MNWPDGEVIATSSSESWDGRAESLEIHAHGGRFPAAPAALAPFELVEGR